MLFKISDKSGAEMTKGLLARIYGSVTAEQIERLHSYSERPAIADRTDCAGIGQFPHHPLDGGIHLARRNNLVADQAPFRTVAEQLALVLDELAGKPVADKALQPQIRGTRNDALFSGRQRHEGV